jgi:hypothetical protein
MAGGDLNLAELGDVKVVDGEHRLGVCFVGVELDQRGGVAEGDHRPSVTRSDSGVLRPARVRAAAS